MKRAVIVYVAGKYMGTMEEIIDHIAIAREHAIKLWEAGFTVITPHLNTSHFEMDCQCIEPDFLEGDLQILQRCDAIFMLPNWTNSKGATAERKVALEVGIPVYENMDMLINDANILYERRRGS